MLHSLSDCTYAVSILHYSMVNCGIRKYRNIHVLQRILLWRIKKLLLAPTSNSDKRLTKLIRVQYKTKKGGSQDVLRNRRNHTQKYSC